MPWRSVRWLAVALVATSAGGATAQAPTAPLLRGTVTVPGGGPAVGALVRAQGAAGAARALTDELGRYRLVLPAPGRYALTLARIGFEPESFDSVEVTASSREVLRDLVAATAAVQLPELVAKGRAACERAKRDPATIALFEQLRTALDAVELSMDDAPLYGGVRTFERWLEPRKGVALLESSAERRGVGRRLFASLPAESLATVGYVHEEPGSVTYVAPDTRVLRADIFSDTHCFRALRADSANRKRVALAFEPRTHQPDLVDVDGALLFDAFTLELQELRFRYVGLRRQPGEALAGGSIEFERFPTGQWFIRRWVIRMPVTIASAEVQRLAESAPPENPIREAAHRGGDLPLVKEDGGSVLFLGRDPADRTFRARPGLVTGLVSDSLAGGALAGAVVTLTDLDRRVTTGTDGAFAFDSVPAGMHRLTVTHPRIDRWYVQPVNLKVDVEPGSARRVRVAIPPLAELYPQLCPGAAGRADGPTIVAVVARATAGGAVVPGLRLIVRWQEPAVLVGNAGSVRELTQSLVTDEAGRAYICDARPGVSLRIAASGRKKGDLEFVPAWAERRWAELELDLSRF